MSEGNSLLSGRGVRRGRMCTAENWENALLLK
jgi:hypothetical protein